MDKVQIAWIIFFIENKLEKNEFNFIAHYYCKPTQLTALCFYLSWEDVIAFRLAIVRKLKMANECKFSVWIEKLYFLFILSSGLQFEQTLYHVYDVLSIKVGEWKKKRVEWNTFAPTFATHAWPWVNFGSDRIELAMATGHRNQGQMNHFKKRTFHRME